MTWLNVGCGSFLAPKPWINIDAHAGNVAVNFADGSAETTQRAPEVVAWSHDLPYPDASVERVYAGHVLEHLDLYQGGVNRTLREFKRVLKPGGELLCVGPDLIRTAEWVHAERTTWKLFWDSHGTAGRGNPSGPAFQGAKPGDVHLWSSSNEAVYALLSRYWDGVRVVTMSEIGQDWPVVARPDWQSAVLAR